MDVLLIIFLTFLNGLFAMSEMALASSRRAVLVALAEEKTVGAQAALELQQRPTEFLSTIQIGITTLGVLNGIIGEAAFRVKSPNGSWGWVLPLHWQACWRLPR